jgi:acyl-coenzyme A thioesterase PaaI-like protein
LAADDIVGAPPEAAADWTGWQPWTDYRTDTFVRTIGRAYMRQDEQGRASVGLETQAGHHNRMDMLHGGFLATFADHAYFCGLRAMGRAELVEGVTLDLSMQYLGVGRVGPPIYAEVELLRETGRLVFMRLLIRQNGQPVAASSATIRKPSRRA